MSAHEIQPLDSSPNYDDSIPRPLKRSASVASLPTPPRTHHKRSRSDCDSSDEDTTRPARTKRSRYKSSADEADQEAAFWTGAGRGSSGAAARKEPQPEKKEKEQSDASPSPALLRYRVKAPVSPPPSRRQPQVQPNRASSVEPRASPVTPPRRLFLRAPSALQKTPTKKGKPSRIWPTRDSPNNPFLKDDASASSKKRSIEWDSTDDEGEVVVGAPLVRQESPTPAPVPSYEERPTITYVFRGQKATFANPLYNLPPEVEAASKLPIDHPDFEPLESFPPKRLFLSGSKRKSRDRSRDRAVDATVKRARAEPALSKPEHAASQPCYEAESEHEEEGEADTEHAEAERRAREDRQRKVKERKEYLAPKEGLRAGAVITERDDPLRRAVGPPRSA
ncbi:hypothetical protein V8B97DRAFT_829365 [Scleroderma yunnanense]